MEIKVKEEDVTHKVQIAKDSKVKDVLSKVGINKETVLVEKNGQVVSEEEKVKDGDVINTILVVSMG